MRRLPALGRVTVDLDAVAFRIGGPGLPGVVGAHGDVGDFDALGAEGLDRALDVLDLEADVPEGLTDVVALNAGWMHSMALRADGTVTAWGDNSYGQTSVPAGLTNAAAIAGGGYHSLALVPSCMLAVASPLGTPVPAVGTNWVIRNALQTCTAAHVATLNGTQHVCTGWSGRGCWNPTGWRPKTTAAGNTIA